MVDDEARQGALRFAVREGGPFLASNQPTRIPPLIELPRLLSAAEHVLSDTDTDEDLRLLLAPGSSLGGARPKASIRDRDGHLAIAKFPKEERRDRYSSLGSRGSYSCEEGRHCGSSVAHRGSRRKARSPIASLRSSGRIATPVPVGDEHARG